MSFLTLMTRPYLQRGMVVIQAATLTRFGLIQGLGFVLLLSFFSCRSKPSLFEEMEPDATGVTFENHPEERKAFGILYYLYYYNGGGVSTGDINNDGLTDIYFTANRRGGNQLYLNKGGFKFEDITENAGVAGSSDWCTGSTMADVNGDGYLDMYVTAVTGDFRLEGHNELFINNRNGTFTEAAKTYGLDFAGYGSQSAFFDYDHDGDLDLFLVNQSHKPNENITDTSRRRIFSPKTGNYLFRNDLKQTGRFTDVSKAAGLYQSVLSYGLGLAVADMNADGWDDVYVGNDFHENDYYYLNNGDGTFTESGAKHFGHYSRFSMGNDAADCNNDGYPDLVTLDMLPEDEKVLKTYGSDENADVYQHKLIHNGYQYQYSKNCLQRNNGKGSSFSELSLQSGVSATDWSWCPLLADFDNDGNKDLFITSGIVKRPVDMDYVKFVSNIAFRKRLNETDALDDTALNRMPDGASHSYLYLGDGAMGFRDESEQAGLLKNKGYHCGAAYADLDNDGDLDLVVNNIDAKASLLRNNSPAKSWLRIRFEGDSMNRQGIGAKVYLFTPKGLQYQQLMPTRGFQSSSDLRLHFGLDTLRQVDSILVVWPDQNCQMMGTTPIGKEITLKEQNASELFVFDHYFPEPAALLVQDSAAAGVWTHRENAFVDFNTQYLIPHAQSTRGPKLAVADVNGDGLDDIFACGARGQPGALLVQKRDGSFSPSDTIAFAADKESEDVDAVFLNANGDGYMDLYVASGGNEQHTGDSLLADRLYLGNGKGGFIKTTGSIPFLPFNKSTVVATDADKDGDVDVFVGAGADAQAYGRAMPSYLLLNDGKGHFAPAPQEVFKLNIAGMVTSAAFTDLTGDGWPELVVAGEWMPITVFINRNGKFRAQEIAGSSGWWQTVKTADVNGDGHTDLLAGNWGWNNKFHSGKNGPVRLYVSDFDLNGQTDQLLSYTSGGVEFPFLAKDEVERPLPLLRKHYLYYAEYAGVPMADVFYGWVDTIQPLKAERLGSAVAYGDGKGGFRLEDLPAGLQSAPIFSFLPASKTFPYFLAGGNFFDVIPYEGRYDAQPLTAFRATASGILPMHQPNLLSLSGQVRDVQSYRTAKGIAYVVARNNLPLVFYKSKSD